MKTCRMCGVTFENQAPAELYCDDCKIVRAGEQRQKRKEYAERKRREAGCKVGRGALPGAQHPNYKHGGYVSQTQCAAYRAKVRYCERCGKDLLNAGHYEWVMHHKDHNHSNHEESNLELLCKSCHQVEHRCWENFTVTCNDYPEGE